MTFRVGIVGKAICVAAVTGVGALFGWAIDESPLPPHGWRWRCCVMGIASVWGLAVVVMLPVLVLRLGKAIARHWAAR